MKKYIYPRLSKQDFVLFRLGGPGLANCLLIAARAYVLAKDNGAEMIRPTWERIGIGQWFRREKDKRFYIGLFRRYGFWGLLKKVRARLSPSRTEFIFGLGNYFSDILTRHREVLEWLQHDVLPESLAGVPKDLKSCVAVHVRLGDYQPPYITPISWYADMIKSMLAKADGRYNILVFSDGTDEQLRPVLVIPGVRRAYYGNALADIFAMSRCRLLIGSDSTFSGWAAYLGQVPCVFPHLHYCQGGSIIEDSDNQKVCCNGMDFPDELVQFLVEKIASNGVNEEFIR